MWVDTLQETAVEIIKDQVRAYIMRTWTFKVIARIQIHAYLLSQRRQKKILKYHINQIVYSPVSKNVCVSVRVWERYQDGRIDRNVYYIVKLDRAWDLIIIGDHRTERKISFEF